MQEDHFPFVYCVEKLVYERKYPEWESCFEELGLDPKRVSECYTGGYGNEVSLLLDLLCFWMNQFKLCEAILCHRALYELTN